MLTCRSRSERASASRAERVTEAIPPKRSERSGSAISEESPSPWTVACGRWGLDRDRRLVHTSGGAARNGVAEGGGRGSGQYAGSARCPAAHHDGDTTAGDRARRVALLLVGELVDDDNVRALVLDGLDHHLPRRDCNQAGVHLTDWEARLTAAGRLRFSRRLSRLFTRSCSVGRSTVSTRALPIAS